MAKRTVKPKRKPASTKDEAFEYVADFIGDLEAQVDKEAEEGYEDINRYNPSNYPEQLDNTSIPLRSTMPAEVDLDQQRIIGDTEGGPRKIKVKVKQPPGSFQDSTILGRIENYAASKKKTVKPKQKK